MTMNFEVTESSTRLLVTFNNKIQGTLSITQVIRSLANRAKARQHG